MYVTVVYLDGQKARHERGYQYPEAASKDFPLADVEDELAVAEDAEYQLLRQFPTATIVGVRNEAGEWID